MRPILLAVLLAVAGCSKMPPEVAVLAGDFSAPVIDRDCGGADPGWQNLPDGPATRSAVMRNYRENKERMRAVLAKRRICRASLKAHGML